VKSNEVRGRLDHGVPRLAIDCRNIERRENVERLGTLALRSQEHLAHLGGSVRDRASASTRWRSRGDAQVRSNPYERLRSCAHGSSRRSYDTAARPEWHDVGGSGISSVLVVFSPES
jgi:hypothetical protein